MNLQSFKLRRKSTEKECKQYRIQCAACRQPEFGCYCKYVKNFDPKIKFVILIHPIEMKRRIATGRMSHLCLKNSELIVGQNFSENLPVNRFLNDSAYQPVILYPGLKSLNLSSASEEKKGNLFLPEKTPLVFVIDGTWATARKMMRQSLNLSAVPKICFTPPGPSQFRVRRQPKAECYSTIEAIHHCIDLLGSQVNFDLTDRPHDILMEVFNQLVERQLQFMRDAFDNPKSTSYRRPKARVA